MDLLSNLSIAQIEGSSEFTLVFEDDAPVKTAGGRAVLRSHSEKFLDYMLSDFWRCTSVTRLPDDSLDFGHVPCAYAVYSDQIQLLNDVETFRGLIENAALIDRLTIQIANGPPAEPKQVEHLTDARQAVIRLIGEQRYRKLEAHNWAQYYAGMMGITSVDDYDGIGTFISLDDFRNSEVCRHLVDRIDQFSDYEKGALVALWHLLGHESLLLPLALLEREISEASFVRTAIFLGSNIADFLDEELLEDPVNVRREQFVHLESVANLALRYAEAGANEKSFAIHQEILKGESQTREFKSTFFLNLATRQKDEIITFVILKTIAAFLNSNGGTVFVGVTDDGKSDGIQGEVDLFFKGNLDKYSLAVGQKLKNAFEGYIDLVDSEIIRAKNGSRLLLIHVRPSRKPVWIVDKGREIFPIRKHPSTETLEGSKQAEYIASHFASAG